MAAAHEGMILTRWDVHVTYFMITLQINLYILKMTEEIAINAILSNLPLSTDIVSLGTVHWSGQNPDPVYIKDLLIKVIIQLIMCIMFRNWDMRYDILKSPYQVLCNTVSAAYAVMASRQDSN